MGQETDHDMLIGIRGDVKYIKADVKEIKKDVKRHDTEIAEHETEITVLQDRPNNSKTIKWTLGIFILILSLFVGLQKVFGGASPTPSWWTRVANTYLHAKKDSVCISGGSNDTTWIMYDRIYIGTRTTDDSLAATIYTAKVLIEDSLDEYALLAGPIFTGSVEIPNSGGPTVNAAGEIAIDTDADGNYVDQGWLTYYDGTQQMYVPAFDAIGTPSDNDVVGYDAGTDKWIVQAQTGGAGEINTLVDTGTFNNTEGFGLSQTKAGVELRVRGLIEGTNVTIAASGDTAYTITAAGAGLTYFTEADDNDTSVFTATGPNTTVGFNDHVTLQGNNLSGVGVINAAGNLTLDDNDGNSPTLTWRDETNNFFSIGKYDAGDTRLYSNAGGIYFQPSGDVNDYLKVSTASNIITLETVASGDGDLVIKAGGGDISFGDENLSTTGGLSVTGNISTDGTVDGVDVAALNTGIATDSASYVQNDEMDASSELLAIMDDETGSAAGTPLLVFNYGPTFNHKMTVDSLTADSIEAEQMIATAQMRAECDFHAEGNIHVNKDSTAADAAIYFGDDDEVASIHWDDANDRFELSNTLFLNGNVALSGTVDGVDVAAFDADVAADSADWNAAADKFDTNYTQITLATVLGAVDIGGATSLEIPAVDDPATDAEGEIAWDANDDAIEVFSGDESESVLIPIYNHISIPIVLPDSVQVYVPNLIIFKVNALIYPHGIEIDLVSIQLAADAAYSMVIEEWSGADPPVLENIISTVTTGASDTYAEEAPDNDAVVDAGDRIVLNIPTTDVPVVTVEIFFHVTAGN